MLKQSSSISKITRPKLSAPLERKRLFKLLDGAREKPVVWLSAPAGSGKTTLASSWLEHGRPAGSPLPCLWYSVDQGDADIASFFYYMGLAAKKAAPRYKKPLPFLTPEYLAGVPVFTRRYFEKLYSRFTHHGFSIVLDNYQDAPIDSPFHDIIANGLDVIPEGVQLIVISRNQPPPQFARLLANNKIALIGWDEIKFNLEETEGFIVGATRRVAQNVEIAQDRAIHRIAPTIHQQTDGWAAGMVLMMEDVGANLVFARSATGSPLHGQTQGLPLQNHENIFNYFAAEIFSKTDKPTQEFLLKTAFIPDMTADMAERLTGEAHAAQILSGLNRNNYFTQRQAAQNPTYRYHPLFQSFLTERAKTTFSGEELNKIRQSAATILAESGQTEQAARLLQDAKEFEGLIKLILTHAQALVIEGRSKTLETWITGIPIDILDKTPWALYWLGICRMAYNPAEARGHLEKAFLRFEKADDVPGMFLSWASIVETFVYEFNDFKPLDHWIAVADKLLAAHPEFPSPEIEVRFAAGMLNALAWRQPHRVDITVWAEQVRQIAHHHPSADMRLRLGSSLIFTYQWVDDFAQAGLLMDALRPVSGLKEITPFIRLNWYAMEGGYYWAIADHAACMNAVTNGLRCAEESGIHLIDWYLLGNGVYSGLSLGDPKAAEACFRKMSEINSPRLMDKAGQQLMAFSVAWYHGDFKKAIEHGRLALKLYEQAGYPLMIAFMNLELAEALFDDGQVEEAHSRLAQGLASGRGISAIQWLYGLRGARFAFERGEEQQGLDFLKQGMAVAAQQGYLNMPRWNNETMSRLCAKALEHGIEMEYVEMLIRKRKLAPPNSPDFVTPSLLKRGSGGVENWPYPVKIYTLGRFEIIIDGKPVEFSGKVPKKPVEMLKAIIALGGGKVSKEKLLDALWPEADGDRQQSAFSTTIARLRELLGDEDIVTVHESKVSLNPGMVWVDVQTFEANADCVIAESKNKEAARLTEKAVSLYHGHFLHGDTDEPWTIPLRERLKIKFLRLAGNYGDYLEKAGKLNKAVEYYEKALAVDNLAEEFYQRLMRCNLRLGRKAEAARVYNSCKSALRNFLGISPSFRTEEIYRELRK